MDRNQLLQLLDLSGTDDANESLSVEATPIRTPSTLSLRPTALEQDDWSLRRGRDVWAANERFAALQLDAFAVADFHTAAFDPDPQLVPECADALRHAFLTELLATPEYHALHESTQLHDAAAVVATTALAEQFAALRDQRSKRPSHEPPTDPVEAASDAAAMAEELATLRAVSRAVVNATVEVDELLAVTAALGMGPGAPGTNNPHAIAALFRRVRSSPTLRRICELAGRYRRVAAARQRHQTHHGRDDVIGVTLGNDLGSLLPVELARLMLPELELDALRRLVERQALCHEYQALEPVGLGPVIVVVDESGSMAGEKVHTAKALALALAWIARRQRRWMALVAYSGDSGERLLALPPHRWDESALCDWLNAFIGGGSRLDVPIRELPRMYASLQAPHGRTDIVVLTDAQCRIEVDLQRPFRAWKQAVGARLLALVIGAAAGDLAAVADEVHLVATLAVTEAAVGRVLSL